MSFYEFVAHEEDENKRLDLFLSEKLLEFSRSNLQKHIRNNKVLVNSLPQKPNYKLILEDKIIFNTQEDEFIVKPENIFLDIQYEDEDIIIVNKQQNMVVHPAHGNINGTLVNGLLYKYKNNLSTAGDKFRPGIVHRIDKDTSGLLVIAKNNTTYNSLVVQFKNQTVIRKYYGIVIGNPENQEGTIKSLIGRNDNNRKKMTENPKHGKKAVTHYKILEYFNGYSLLEFALETGRTHQIRVHLASIGHPILGDMVYGITNQKVKVKGQMLHAKTLGFIHPGTGKHIEFDSELPDYFKEVIERIKNL